MLTNQKNYIAKLHDYEVRFLIMKAVQIANHIGMGHALFHFGDLGNRTTAHICLAYHFNHFSVRNRVLRNF